MPPTPLFFPGSACHNRLSIVVGIASPLLFVSKVSKVFFFYSFVSLIRLRTFAGWKRASCPVAAALFPEGRERGSTYSLTEASARSRQPPQSPEFTAAVIKWALCSSRTPKSLGNCRDAACRKTLDPTCACGMDRDEINIHPSG